MGRGGRHSATATAETAALPLRGGGGGGWERAALQCFSQHSRPVWSHPQEEVSQHMYMTGGSDGRGEISAGRGKERGVEEGGGGGGSGGIIIESTVCGEKRKEERRDNELE